MMLHKHKKFTITNFPQIMYLSAVNRCQTNQKTYPAQNLTVINCQEIVEGRNGDFQIKRWEVKKSRPYDTPLYDTGRD